MTELGYREFVDSEYTRLRKGLLAHKGSDRQEEFLETARSSRGFVDYLSGSVRTQGIVDLTLHEIPMSESEFSAPPPDTEARLYDSWVDVDPRTACRTTFWANVTCRHVREGRIQSSYLAANGANSAGGAVRIDKALTHRGSKRPKLLDDCVRTILRRLGGIPEQRGKRTVYVDCPLARAWWREWLARQVSKGDAEVARRVGVVLRINQTYWEKIIDRIVSRNSTFGSEEVRAAFILALAELVEDPESALRKPKELIRACRRVAACQATRELSILDDNELRDIMAIVLRSA